MRSQLAGIEWPAFPDAGTASLLALAWQLEQSQWWPAAELVRHQHRQLARVLAHAGATVPFHQARFAAAGCRFVDGDELDVAAWARVPIATRDDLIAAGDDLLSRSYPARHGAVHDVFTSRTTGQAVRLRATDVTAALWNAITLRDHAWHRRELSARLGAIRYLTEGGAAPPDGARGHGWGPATAAIAPDAPVSLLSIASTIDEQVAWLVREDPAYLVVYPSVLDAIVRQVRDRGLRLPSLRQVRTISEALTPATRALATEVLGVPVVDTYSAQEVGYLALECPTGGRYHVQAERLLVELVDERGRPCPPGEPGRVIVTDLHNFATPLVRYDLGDVAVAGEPCPCGRGLPVLTRVIGRRRGLLVYPDGRVVWPLFSVACRDAARYRELQLVQESVERLRLRVVPEAPLSAGDRGALAAAVQRALGHPFTVDVEEVAALDRSPTGKLEEFVSRVAP